MLRRADADYQAGNLEAAKLTCETLIAGDLLTAWAYFFLGRIHRDQGGDDRAIDAFTKAIEHDSALFWAHAERLFLASKRGIPADRLAIFARDMASIAWEPLQAAHVHRIELVAHGLWAAGHIDSAFLLFERLWPSADLSPLALLRIVEAGRGPGLVAEAGKRIAALPEIYDAIIWILVEHLGLQGGMALNDASLASRGGADLADFDSRMSLARARAAEGARSAPRADDRIRAGARSEDVRQIEAIAHVLWDGNHFDTAHRLFEQIWFSPDLQPLTLIRVIESDRDDARVAEAVQRLLAFHDLDENAVRILNQHFEKHGLTERDVALLENHYATSPAGFPVGLWLVRAYARRGDADPVAAIETSKALAPRQRSLARLWADIERGDAQAAFLAFRDHVRRYGEAPLDAGARLVHLLGGAFEVARRDEVLRLISAYHEGDPEVALLHIYTAMRDQAWDDARALLDRHFPNPGDWPENVRLANIEIHAFAGQFEAAAALLSREQIGGLVSPAFLPAALRILGELDRWQEAFDAGIGRLAGDPSFEHVLSVMIRAGRKTGRTSELFDALMALPRPLRQAQQDALFAVMEDLAEAGHADILGRAGGVAVPRERERRILLKLRASGAAEAAEPKKDLCIYYCADEAYLTPALVSLTALAMSNAGLARRAAFKLVVDAGVVPVATEAAGAIARRLGFALEVIDATTIVPSPERLRTSYGLYTGGQQLALAAYYRIFYARRLAETREYQQALYIDADTLVRGGLNELFSLERAGPLMARDETDRPEVRYATRVHRLSGRYFNSGILLFDLAHPELPALLDRTIEAALDPTTELVFQDQCALNIAFDTRVDKLPARFNYFTPPEISADGVTAADAVIVHFLDRPKPWDSLYRQSAREWFEWFELVATLRKSAPPQAV